MSKEVCLFSSFSLLFVLKNNVFYNGVFNKWLSVKEMKNKIPLLHTVKTYVAHSYEGLFGVLTNKWHSRCGWQQITGQTI